MDNRNTWLERIKRNTTAILPVSKNRYGKCISCGECCKLVNKCPFLKYKEDGRAYCLIYHVVRPLSCKKYPRIKDEFITEKTCGYYFN